MSVRLDKTIFGGKLTVSATSTSNLSLKVDASLQQNDDDEDDEGEDVFRKDKSHRTLTIKTNNATAQSVYERLTHIMAQKLC